MRLAVALFALLTPQILGAASIEKTVYLVDHEGKETSIGNVTLGSPGEATHSAQVILDDTKFSDHFLSMRPFKCISGQEGYQLCHLPYPYTLKNIISSDDLTDLEYKLLFIRRSATDYGINPWFGIYYQMSAKDGELTSLNGTLHEVNLDLLASPPEEGNLRPLPDSEIYEVDLQQHPWPRLVIR